MNPKFSDLTQKLEAERNDLSYKNPKPLPTNQPYIRPRMDSKKRDQRDKLMFNAGRYAAGARDSVAVAANEWLQTL